MKNKLKVSLHDKAETKLKRREDSTVPLKKADLLKIIHEMQAKQLELEKQNGLLEQARAEAEEAYRQYTDLYDFAPAGYFTLSRAGIIHKVNLPGADLVGMEHSRLIGQPLTKLVLDTSLSTYHTFFERLLSSMGRESCELEILKAGKSSLWVHIDATCFEGGMECRAVVTDIGERKQAQDALEKIKNLLAETERMGNVGGWEFDINTKKQIWTEEVYRIHEVDITHKPTVEKGINFYTASSKPIIERAVRSAIENGEPFDEQLEIITAKGNHRWVHVIGKADLKNRRVFGFFQNITERKIAEALLRESEERFRTLVEQAPTAIYLQMGGKFAYINKAGLSLFGADDEQQLIGTPVLDRFHPMFREQVRRRIQQVNEKGEATPAAEEKVLKFDGTSIEAEISSTPFYFKGEHGGLVFLRDITERKQGEGTLQARLRISQFADTHSLDELLQKTLDEAEALTDSKIGFAHFLKEDQKTLHLQMWSSNTLNHMCTAEGKGSHYPVEQAGVWAECIYTRAPVVHNNYESLAHRKGLPQGHAPILRELVVPVLRNDLIVMIMGVGNKPSDYHDNDVETISQLSSLAWDIIQRKQVEDALKLSERKYRLLHESMIDGFASVDINGNFQECNEEYRNMLGYTREELAQLTYKDITPEKWHALEVDIVENQIMKRGYSDIYEKEYIRKDGTVFPVELHTMLLRNEDGRPEGMWAIVRDITERKYIERAIEMANLELQTALAREKQLARTDPLTGVHNRRHLYELANHELQVAIRYRQALSVIMFDIDHFKNINDYFGHEAGDQILKRVTDVACAELRSSDVIGRYGGEEFIVILPMTNAQQAFQLAERIRVNVTALKIQTPKGAATVSLSIGIVEISHAKSEETLEEIFRRVDKAMYAAKQAGRNRTETR
ncbi:MAG: PAS domain S-box protein [Anaerolineales bacterium]